MNPIKTGKEISKEDFHTVLGEKYSNILFEKKTATLFINVIPKAKEVWFSVFNKSTHGEEKFDLMYDAAKAYNWIK